MATTFCAYCGTKHDRHEDAGCGCGCGDEPMGCPACMSEGGPSRRYDARTGRELSATERFPSLGLDMDDPEYGSY